MTRTLTWLLLVGGVLIGSLLAAWHGLSADWDLFNYHLYNPHALLHDRLQIDIAPAQMQSYFNPLLHIPYYLLFWHLGATFMAAVAGALQGLHWLMLGLLVAAVCPVPAWSRSSIAIVAALGMLGPIFVFQLGGLQGDTQLSLLVLAALLIVLRMDPREISPRWLLLAGSLLGFAAAAKLTFALYAVGMGIALMLTRPPRVAIVSAAWFALGGLAGFLIGGGAWFFHLWTEYQSPLFPYFNELFQSDWIRESSYRDLRFMPKNLLDWLAYPVVWAFDPYKVWEYPFRDIRPALLYLPMLLLPVIFWKRLGREMPRLRFLLVFLAASYLVWLPLFSIYRYLSVFEMLAPLALFGCALFLFGRRPRVIALSLSGLLATQLVVSLPRPGSLPELEVAQHSALRSLPPDSMVVAAGYDPLAYTALWLSDDIPFVRIRANFMYEGWPEMRMLNEADRRVREHTGPRFLLHLAANMDDDTLKQDLNRVGLAVPGRENCRPVFEDPRLQERTGVSVCLLRRR